MRQLQSDPCVQQHLGLKSTWDRAKRTQNGLFTIFPSLHSDFLGSKTSKPDEKQRGRKCPTQGTPPQGALRLLSVEMVCQAEVFLTCANTLRSLKEVIYPFLEGDSTLPAPAG